LGGLPHETTACKSAQQLHARLQFVPRGPPYAAIDTDEHTMTSRGISASGGSHKAARSRQTSKQQEPPELLHTGPVVTTVQAKATFIPQTDHLAFDKAVNRAAGRVRRGQAELPFTLTGAFRWVQLVHLGRLWKTQAFRATMEP
jgi:hypothetical protein